MPISSSRREDSSILVLSSFLSTSTLNPSSLSPPPLTSALTDTHSGQSKTPFHWIGIPISCDASEETAESLLESCGVSSSLHRVARMDRSIVASLQQWKARDKNGQSVRNRTLELFSEMYIGLHPPLLDWVRLLILWMTRKFEVVGDVYLLQESPHLFRLLSSYPSCVSAPTPSPSPSSPLPSSSSLSAECLSEHISSTKDEAQCWLPKIAELITLAKPCFRTVLIQVSLCFPKWIAKNSLRLLNFISGTWNQRGIAHPRQSESALHPQSEFGSSGECSLHLPHRKRLPLLL